MAEVNAPAPTLSPIEQQLQDALTDVGSALTVQPVGHETAPVDDAPLEVPTEAIEPEPPLEPQPAEPAPWEARLQPLEQRLTNVVSKDDLAALQEQWRKDQQETLTTLVQALRQPVQQPQTQEPARQPLSITQAAQALFLNGDASQLEAYEAEQRRNDEARRIAQAQAERQQKLIVALAQNYPFTQSAEGFRVMAQEYQRLMANPMTRLALQHDPGAVVQFGDTQMDLRVALTAAEAVRSRAEAHAAADAARQQATQAAQQDTRQQQAPAAQGGAQRQAPRQQPTHLLPAHMVQGKDALLNDPAIQRALANAGWGEDVRTQAKRLAERLPAATRTRLQQEFRAGQGGVVGAA